MNHAHIPMMLSQGLFWKRLQQLTVENLANPELVSKLVVPEKYGVLFHDKIIDGQVTLKDICEVVDDILLPSEDRLDEFGRFDRNYSKLAVAGLDQSPIIDELILDVIKQLRLPRRNIWPANKKAVVCLTHDVDAIDGFSYFWVRKANWYWLKSIAKLTGNQRAADAWAATIEKWNRFRSINFDPMSSIDQICELEASYGFRSTYFFMSLDHGLSIEGRRYGRKNPLVAKAADTLLKGGWEIGLHAAYHNHLSPSSLTQQKQRLEDVIQEQIAGCRHHYLRVRFPESWAVYAQAGFKYSSNMAWYTGFQGFKAGTCIPYQPLSDYSLLEIPFQLMDANPITAEGIESLTRMFDRYFELAKSVGGCLVINFHQENFREEVIPGVGNAYRNILRIIANDPDVAILTMKDVYTHLVNLNDKTITKQ